jgi:hypothetical protein
MADIVDRLELMISRHVLRAIPGAAAHLEGSDTRRLLTEYATWRQRFVSPTPRAVLVSPELASSPEAITYARALEVMRAKIENGTDVTAHLSQKIHRPFANTAAPQMEHRTDRDALLSIWGLHHLHLSERATAIRIPRGDDVLIAALNDSTAYLVAIIPHPTPERGWVTQQIFEVIARNWPDARLVRQAETVIGLSEQLADAERRAVLNAGISTMMEVDGKVYLPATLGQMADGTPGVIAHRAMGLMEMVRRCREDFEGTLRSLAPVPDRAYWTPEIQCPRPGFEEWFGFGTTTAAGSLFVPVGRIV